ncbi:MAG: hypothetical protein RLZZ416_337 [Candidatus Parcubacteria bacterium]|jgi:hypothetical protein
MKFARTHAGLMGLVFLAAAAPILTPTRLHAQGALIGIERAAMITTSPVYPGANEAVHLELTSSALDLDTSSIVWLVDGKAIAQGIGVTSVDVSTGALGTQKEVEVNIATANNIAASAKATIVPTGLDLLVDSDSYVPPFYRGRALASAGTNLIVEAIPYFRGPSGPVSAPDLTYIWKRDGEAIGSVSGKGHFIVSIPSPHLYGSDTISVEARSSDGLFSGKASVTIPSIQPTLVLYEDHPLYGIRLGQAFGATSFVSGSEMAFAAIPYFAQARTAHDPALSYEWRVNDALIPVRSGQENEITINAKNSTGRALIGLELTHKTNFYLDAKSAWNVIFSSGDAGQNPFGGF